MSEFICYLIGQFVESLIMNTQVGDLNNNRNMISSVHVKLMYEAFKYLKIQKLTVIHYTSVYWRVPHFW